MGAHGDSEGMTPERRLRRRRRSRASGRRSRRAADADLRRPRPPQPSGSTDSNAPHRSCGRADRRQPVPESRAPTRHAGRHPSSRFALAFEAPRIGSSSTRRPRRRDASPARPESAAAPGRAEPPRDTAARRRPARARHRRCCTAPGRPALDRSHRGRRGVVEVDPRPDPVRRRRPPEACAGDTRSTAAPRRLGHRSYRNAERSPRAARRSPPARGTGSRRALAAAGAGGSGSHGSSSVFTGLPARALGQPA